MPERKTEGFPRFRLGERFAERLWKTEFSRHMAGATIEVLQAMKCISLNNLFDAAIEVLEEKRKPAEKAKKVNIK